MSEVVDNKMKTDGKCGTKFCGKTTIKKSCFMYEWSVDDFNEVLDKNYNIPSPVFCSDVYETKVFRLELFTESMYPEGQHAALRLVNLSEDGKALIVSYSLSIVDSFGNDHPIQAKEKLFYNYLESDGCILMNHKKLIKGNFLTNNCLTIRIKIDMFLCIDETKRDDEETANVVGDINLLSFDKGDSKNLKMSSEIKLRSTTPIGDNDNFNKFSYNIVANEAKEDTFKPESIEMNTLRNLSDHLKALYTSKYSWDIKITTKDAEFQAHRVILCARSEYFKNSCVACNGNVLVINDVSTSIMENILFHVYTGKIRQISVESGLDLLNAAKKFRLPSFQQLVIEILKQKLTVQNITDVIQWSEGLNLQDLKKACLIFASKNYDVLLRTDKWNALAKNYSHITGEILEIISVRSKDIF